MNPISTFIKNKYTVPPLELNYSHLLSTPHGQGVVLLTPVVGVEKLLEPLNKLEIVLGWNRRWKSNVEL